MGKANNEEGQARMKLKAEMLASKPLMGIEHLPRVVGNERQPYKTKSGTTIRPRTAHCPIHGSKGRETDWVPPSGIDPATVEFSCQLGHAFYEKR